MSTVRPALIARLYRAIEQNRMSDAVILLSQVFSYYGSSKQARDRLFLNELRKLGDEYRASGDLIHAEEHYKLSLALYESFFSEQHDEALGIMRRLCELLDSQLRQEELGKALDWAYRIVQRLRAQVEGVAVNTYEAINWHTVFVREQESSASVVNYGSVAETDQIRVLLVEDNEDDATLVEDQLSNQSVNLQKVTHLSEGIVRLTDSKVDVILLDLNLPDSQQLDTFYRVLSTAPSTPIIVLTGMDDRLMAIRAIKKGAHDYLVKGRDKGETLFRSIMDAVEHRQSRDVERITQSAASRTIEESIESAPLPMMYLDRFGLLKSANQAWCDLAKGQSHQFVGHHVCDLFDSFSKEMLASINANKCVEIRHVIGGEPCRIVIWPVRSPSNGIIGALLQALPEISFSDDETLN